MAGFLTKMKHLLIGAGAPHAVAARKPLKKLKDHQLSKLESEIGQKLFGPLTKDKSSELFCLDDTTWVWYEQWRDERGISQSHTVRYEVHPKGILKVEDEGKNYHFLKDQELENLAVATSMYYERAKQEIYQQPASKLQTV